MPDFWSSCPKDSHPCHSPVSPAVALTKDVMGSRTNGFAKNIVLENAHEIGQRF